MTALLHMTDEDLKAMGIPMVCFRDLAYRLIYLSYFFVAFKIIDCIKSLL